VVPAAVPIGVINKFAEERGTLSAPQKRLALVVPAAAVSVPVPAVQVAKLHGAWQQDPLSALDPVLPHVPATPPTAVVSVSQVGAVPIVVPAPAAWFHGSKSPHAEDVMDCPHCAEVTVAEVPGFVTVPPAIHPVWHVASVASLREMIVNNSKLFTMLFVDQIQNWAVGV